MLYSEFAENTGCRDNEHNHEVFRNLEVMYMNTDMTKAEIYEYGKKLVDNSKTERELEIEAQVNKEIAEYKEWIAWLKAENERYTEDLNNVSNTIEEEKSYKASIKANNKRIKQFRNKIKALKWVLA